MNGPKQDSIVLSRADYEVLVRDGLRNIESLAKRALELNSMSQLEGWLSTMSATVARTSSLQNKWKSITFDQSFPSQDSIVGTELLKDYSANRKG